MKVTLRGRYSGRSTTAIAKERVSAQGYTCLYLNKRQIREAADRCCYAGDDYPRLDPVPGFGDWGPTQDDGMDAWRLT